MIDVNKKYYSKLMLFGEYSIICNSMGLTVPYDKFHASLSFTDDSGPEKKIMAERSNSILKSFCQYLESIKLNRGKKAVLDLESFSKDISSGLYLDSNIPEGYGVGSSGALCAAVYDNYSLDKKLPDSKSAASEILVLKALFSQMESYFHGFSSGIDPLSCYLHRALLIEENTGIKLYDFTRDDKISDGALFLIDSGSKSTTDSLVQLFRDKCRIRQFMNIVESEFIPSVNNSIRHFIEWNLWDFFGNLKKLSQFQLTHLSPMIPSNITEAWQHGLDTGDFFLKLCGSGGGGYNIGFTTDIVKAKQLLNEYGFETSIVYSFSINDSSMIL